MRRIRCVPGIAALIALTFASAPLHAQALEAQAVEAQAPAALALAPASGASASAHAAAAPAIGPTFGAARLGIATDDAGALASGEHPAVNREASHIGRREGRALAIVGGAAVLAGVLIGDTGGTVIAIGGAAVGLYGLYEWQR